MNITSEHHHSTVTMFKPIDKSFLLLRPSHINEQTHKQNKTIKNIHRKAFHHASFNKAMA